MFDLRCLVCTLLISKNLILFVRTKLENDL